MLFRVRRTRGVDRGCFAPTLRDGREKDVHRTDGSYFRITILRVLIRHSPRIHKISSVGLFSDRPGCVDKFISCHSGWKKANR